MPRCRVKPYSLGRSHGAMVVVQCPHCCDDVELQDRALGLFECPHCDEEFEYQRSPVANAVVTPSVGGIDVASRGPIGLFFGSMVMILFGCSFLYGAKNDFSQSADSTECDKGPWIDSLIDPPNCSSDGDWGLGSLCAGGCLIFLGVGTGLGAAITFVSNSVSGKKRVSLRRQGT